MKGCVVHASNDVRLEERAEADLTDGQVRLDFEYGGVCGSDIHYFQHGRVGDSVVRDPMILGHEFSGVVRETHSSVGGLTPGNKVAVNPALPCSDCQFCRKGLTNLCADTRFMGSAAFRPHCDGGFVERPVVAASQCIRLPEDADLRHVAMAEPYAVALHALTLAGDLNGKDVLVSGAGVIGQLVAVAARRTGAARVAMSDISPEALRRSIELGGNEVIDATDTERTAMLATTSEFDVAFEASGAPSATNLCVGALHPRGKMIQVGFLPPEAPLTLAKLLTRELWIMGTYRFIDEFDEAVRQIVASEVDLRPMISRDMSIKSPSQVFAAAVDKSSTLKVMVHFR